MPSTTGALLEEGDLRCAVGVRAGEVTWKCLGRNTCQQAEMELKFVKGERVILTDNCCQVFLGEIKSINYELGRIVLSDVVQLPEHKIITGYRHFDKNEIIKIRKYEPDGHGKPEFAKVPQEEPPQVVPEGDPTPPEPENTLPEPVQNKIKKFPSEYCYISAQGAQLESAIAAITSCNKVGLHGGDTHKGRSERLSVLAVSTPTRTFIFDLQTLGDDVFNLGLKEILESPAITKVVHDCRMLSDCLKHKHVVNLEKVRDVEAEDIMVLYQERRAIRKHIRPLEYLIKVYLGEEVKALNAFDGLWNNRPLPENQLAALASLSAYLVPLQEVIQEKYLQRLLQASNIYNNYVRSKDFYNFLHQESGKTLRKEMTQLVRRHMEVRMADAGQKY